MHTNTHPEPDERTPKATTPPPQADTSSELLAALVAAKSADELSLNRLAQMLGYSPSVLSQYLDGKYPGDVKRLERRIADWLRTRDRLRKGGVRLVESEEAMTVMSALETIRRTNDVGLIHGDAGIGKTSGVILYGVDNPTCINITLERWARTDCQIEGLVFAEIESRAWKGNTSRGQFIVEKLRGSSRLLIVDNAHKATAAGIEWLFDLHDETRIPIALVGNAEVLRHIERNDQRFSRIGLMQPVTLQKPKALIRHLIDQIAPSAKGLVNDLAEQVVDNRGRYRAVAKQLSLAAQISEGSGLGAEDAFKAAHKRLVREYALA